MNVIINIFFIFIFTFWVLFFRIPDIDNRNYLFHKLIIFVLLFVYQFSLLVLSKIKNKCKIDLLDVCGYSFETAIVGIIGYSIYTDLQYYDLGMHNFHLPILPWNEHIEQRLSRCIVKTKKVIHEKYGENLAAMLQWLHPHRRKIKQVCALL